MGEIVPLSDEEFERLQRENPDKAYPPPSEYTSISNPTPEQEADAMASAPQPGVTSRRIKNATNMPVTPEEQAAIDDEMKRRSPAELARRSGPDAVAGRMQANVSAAAPGRWDALKDEAMRRYPALRDKVVSGAKKAAGVAAAVAPALSVGPVGGFSPALQAAGQQPQERAGAPAEKPQADEAQQLSDRAKAIAATTNGGATGDIERQFPEMPTQTIPAHWQDVSRVTKEPQLTPADAESVRTSTQAATGQRAEGLEHLEAAAAHKALTDAAYSRWRNDFERQNLAETQQANAQRERAVNQRLSAADDAMSKYDASVRGLKGARAKLFASDDTAAGIVGTLAVALGFFTSMMGKGNPIMEAMKMADERIQKDIDAQQSVVDASGKRVEYARNALGDAYRALGDKDAAREMVRAQQLQYAAAQADMMSGQAKDEETKARLSEMKGNLLDAAAESRAKVAQLTNAQVTRDERFIPRHTEGGGPQFAALNVTPGQIVGTPSGGEVAVRSDKAAQGIQDRQAMEKNLGRTLKQIDALDRKATAIEIANPLSEYHRQRDRLVAQVIPQMSQAQDKSVVRAGEEERIEKAAGAGYGLLDKIRGREPLAGDAARALEGGSEEMINAQHGVGVREVIVFNKKTGKYEQQYVPTKQDAQARPQMPASAQKVGR